MTLKNGPWIKVSSGSAQFLFRIWFMVLIWSQNLVWLKLSNKYLFLPEITRLHFFCEHLSHSSNPSTTRKIHVRRLQMSRSFLISCLNRTLFKCDFEKQRAKQYRKQEVIDKCNEKNMVYGPKTIMNESICKGFRLWIFPFASGNLFFRQHLICRAFRKRHLSSFM